MPNRKCLANIAQVRVSNSGEKAGIDNLFSEHTGENQLIRSLISRLFPAASRHIGNSSYGSEWKRVWLRDSRVAHPEVLRFYFERFESEEFKAFSLAKTFLDLTTLDEMSSFLEGLDIETLGKCIQSLENFEQDFPINSIVPVSKSLLNSLPRLASLSRSGFLQITPRLIVTRVILRLLRSLPSGQVDTPVLEILSSLNFLSSKLTLIELVGHRQNVGHGLISETLAKQLEMNLLAEIRRTAPRNLLSEFDLIGLLMTRAWWDPGSPKILPDNIESEVIQAIFAAAISDGFEQSFDSRATRRIAHLQWDAILEIFGDSQAVQNAVYKIEYLNNNSDKTVEAISKIKEKLANQESDRISGETFIQD